jgi:hypothetical protein
VSGDSLFNGTGLWIAGICACFCGCYQLPATSYQNQPRMNSRPGTGNTLKRVRRAGMVVAIRLNGFLVSDAEFIRWSLTMPHLSGRSRRSSCSHHPIVTNLLAPGRRQMLSVRQTLACLFVCLPTSPAKDTMNLRHRQMSPPARWYARRHCRGWKLSHSLRSDQCGEAGAMAQPMKRLSTLKPGFFLKTWFLLHSRSLRFPNHRRVSSVGVRSTQTAASKEQTLARSHGL